MNIGRELELQSWSQAVVRPTTDRPKGMYGILKQPYFSSLLKPPVDRGASGICRSRPVCFTWLGFYLLSLKVYGFCQLSPYPGQHGLRARLINSVITFSLVFMFPRHLNLALRNAIK